MTTEAKSLAFYGHHKCATTWARGILGSIAPRTGRSMATFDNPRQFGGDLAAHLKKQPSGIIAYTNADIEQVRRLSPMPAFHIIRDPRDVLVSGYFSHRNSHPTKGWPELIAYREKIQALNTEDGLLAEIDFSGPTIDLMGTWDYQQESVLELSFEEMVADPYAAWLRIGLHLRLVEERETTWLDDLSNLSDRLLRVLQHLSRQRIRKRIPRSKVPAETFLGIVHQHRFSKLAKGRRPGEEDASSHYRKGEPGDWKNHFTSKVEARFQERFPGLLDKLGYCKL